MSDHEQNISGSQFRIWVNPDVAFTMLYEDADGKLLFSIEVADDPKIIYLSSQPSEGNSMADMTNPSTRQRVNTALERLRKHFENQGLSVELD